MAGIDDNVALLGDWITPIPSPRTFVSGTLGNDSGLRSSSAPSGGSGNNGLFTGAQEHMAAEDTSKTVAMQSCNKVTELSSFSEQKSSRGGLVERMAARAGFNAPRLNTESIKSSGLSINSDVRSPYLTIPPGLSPTTLLESPILLTNARGQPSPTTGQFPFVSNGNDRSSTLMSEDHDKSKDNMFQEMDSSFFSFRPAAESEAMFLNPTSKTNSASLPPSFQTDNSLQPQISDRTKDIFQFSIQKDNEINNIAPDKMTIDAGMGSAVKSQSLEEQQDEGDQKGSGESVAGAGSAASEDGYNWRKYGQKQVKGSEYPRSYYKCTHPNCQVKKKVERSHEGHITEIIYKGSHEHPKPLPNRRSAIGSSNTLDLQLDFPEQGRQQNDVNGDPTWPNMQRGNTPGNPEWGNESIEVTSSAPMESEFGNPASTLQRQNSKQMEQGDGVDVSSTFSNDEDDDRGTHGSVSLAYEGEEDESESKRRKLEASVAEMSGASRAIREPRVVVQTTSEVDILDDGYRWRKYGQKVVKGNPNPRSYYKCTSPGCPVRKHVERASHDLKSVITTYEGKHNHDVPAARNSNHVNSGTAAHMNQAAAAAVHSNVHRPEPSQVQNSMGRFERPPLLNPFHFPGRPNRGPSPGFSFGINQQGLPNMTLGGFGPSQGRMPVMPVHPFLSQRPMNDMGVMLPKEPKLESLPEPGLNLPTSSPLYQQLMGRLPLGPPM